MVRNINDLYLSPPESALAQGMDKKSQIQALEHTQPALSMKLATGRALFMTMCATAQPPGCSLDRGQWVSHLLHQNATRSPERAS